MGDPRCCRIIPILRDQAPPRSSPLLSISAEVSLFLLHFLYLQSYLREWGKDETGYLEITRLRRSQAEGTL